MSQDIDQSFVKQYEREVHTAYQRQGSLLRNTVRVKNGVKGESTTFQKVGKGSASTKTRHGDVPLMNADHTPVECTLTDYYAADYIDKLDELKINHSEREVVVRAGAFALGRKTDDLIITAAAGSTTYSDAWGLATTTLAKFTDAITTMADRDVRIVRGETFGVVTWQLWDKLIQIPQFNNADYIGPDDLPFKSGAFTNRVWMDVIWIPHSGLSTSGVNHVNLLYDRRAIGHAIGADVTTMMDWVPQKAAYLADNMMSQGSVAIDAEGIQLMLVNQST